LALELLSARQSDEAMVFVGPASLRGFLFEQFGEELGPGVEWLESGSVEPSTIVSGEPDEQTGETAYRSLREALKLSLDRFDGLLTLPLSKESVQSAGYEEFVGHTELLEEHYDTRGVMAFFGSELNVALVTRHQPLRDVPESITTEQIVRTARTVSEYFETERNMSPSMAVLGLNPHAGEGGRLGSEDQNIIEPAVASLKEENLDIVGPVPADGFIPVNGESVDVILACYHDQGLVPFKQRHFFDGVHATLGLPLKRVSPDHGIAADRAPSGDVDPTSTLNCLRWLRGDPPESSK
jgi:4-hydroxythreonine-4-phosphate dehydrogenase